MCQNITKYIQRHTAQCATPMLIAHYTFTPRKIYPRHAVLDTVSPCKEIAGEMRAHRVRTFGSPRNDSLLLSERVLYSPTISQPQHRPISIIGDVEFARWRGAHFGRCAHRLLAFGSPITNHFRHFTCGLTCGVAVKSHEPMPCVTVACNAMRY